MNAVTLENITIDNTAPLVLMAGPCAIEGIEHALATASAIRAIARRVGLDFIYKSSFDKANRTSTSSHRGLGLEEGLRVLAAVKQEVGCPVMTDVHLPAQCAEVAEVVDILQIPAFLCRQTDLLQAAARTGRIVNIKKGQFLAPWDMTHAVEKVRAANEHAQVLVCERGTSFGYNRLISDMRSLTIMAESAPVVFDATHSVQEPGGLGGRSGGERRFVATLARAAVAVGVAAVFIETHENPDAAPSDGPNMVPLDALESLLQTLKRMDAMAKQTQD